MDDKPRKRLERIVRTKIRTAFIGALSAIEESVFYDMAKNDHVLFREFQAVRAKILNRGNEQIRDMEKEMGMYDIRMNRFQYTMPVLKTREEYEAYKKGLKDAQQERND
jgi:hypothetical protein